MHKKEVEQASCFVLVFRPVRPGEEETLQLGDETLGLPEFIQTKYTLSIDPKKNQVLARPYEGDPNQVGEAEVFDLRVPGQLDRLRQLVQSYNEEAFERGPRTRSSKRVEEPATYDATDESKYLRLCAQFTQLLYGFSFGSDEAQIEAVSAKAVEIEKCKPLPQNGWGEVAGKQWSEKPKDPNPHLPF